MGCVVDKFCAQRLYKLTVFLRSRSVNCSASVEGKLNREMTNTACARMDQHALPGRKFRNLKKCLVCRQGCQGSGTQLLIGNTCRCVHKLMGRSQNVFGICLTRMRKLHQPENLLAWLESSVIARRFTN